MSLPPVDYGPIHVVGSPVRDGCFYPFAGPDGSLSWY